VSITAPRIEDQDSASRLARAWRLSCTGEVPAALELAYQLHAAAAAEGNRPARAGAAFQIAHCCLQLGRIDEGMDHARAAAQLYSHLGQPAGEATSRALYAWLLVERADSDLALDEISRALELVPAADPPARGFILNAAGVVYWLIKQPEKAILFLDEAVAIARAEGDELCLGRWLANLAGAQAELGLMAELQGDDAGLRHWTEVAIRTEEAALIHLARSRDTWCQRTVLCNIAEHCTLLGDFAAAQDYLDQHAATTGPVGAREAVHFEFTKAQLLSASGRLDEAIECYQRSLATEPNGDMEQALLTTRSLAQAYEQAGRYREALATHQRYHALYVRVAEEAVQRRARMTALGYENARLKATAKTLESENNDLLRKTETLARSLLEDNLTKLPNRRHLEAALFEVLVSGENYAIAMIDVDNFKQINDRYSHMAGDEVLRQVGQIIRQSCRQEDLPARYGGEEFALLLRGAAHQNASSSAERLRAAIAGHDWRAAGLTIPQVTVSIGTATWNEAQSPNAVLALADQRLYRAKAMGRNRVVSQDES
jgi:diguanylate cyclase (GGDEF)-like protein